MAGIAIIKDFINYKITSKNAHGLHSPFVFHLYNNVITESGNYYKLDELSKLRKLLLSDQTELLIEDFGAGSKKFKGNKRRVGDICKHGISKEKYARLLFRLVNYFAPKTIIELGTSIGLTTLYFARAAKNAQICTIEGSSSIADFAEGLFAKQNEKNIELVRGNFDDQLPLLLNRIEQIDFAYIDGNHRKEATINYFEQILKKCNKNSVIVLDDIYWSEGMKEAWNYVKQNARVTLTIDLFYMGIVFLRTEQKNKEHFVIKF